jgi:hypothetical protein
MIQISTIKHIIRLTFCLTILLISSRVRAQEVMLPNQYNLVFPKIDTTNKLENRLLSQKDSLDRLSKLSISLRDSINQPKPLRREQIRAERREHAYAASAVAVLATLTFILYNLRTQ